MDFHFVWHWFSKQPLHLSITNEKPPFLVPAPRTSQVISKMAEKLQPPDPHRFSWERHTVVVQSQDGDSVDSAKDRDAGGSATLEGAAKTVGAGGAAMPAFWEVIAAAAEDPVPSLPTAYSTSEECKARIEQLASLLSMFSTVAHRNLIFSVSAVMKVPRYFTCHRVYRRQSVRGKLVMLLWFF